jgi:glutathione synthase/RimK-type ligase-like ATP-grasp enzyme
MKKRKKQVLVLPSPNKIKKIEEKLPENVEIVKGSFSNIEFRFNHKLRILHKGKDLKTFDFIWLTSLFNTRGISHAISAYLDYHEVAHTRINYGRGTSKIVDLTKAELNGIPIPNTFFQTNSETIEKKLDVIIKLCHFPLIIKDTKGCRGRNSCLVHTKKELVDSIKEFPSHKHFILQEFIPNDFDWGLLVANGKVLAAEKSFRKEGEFRNNACFGAKENFIDSSKVSKELKNIAIKMSRILKLEWGRADIVIDKYTKEPYLLEFNRFPGMTAGSPEESAFSHYLMNKLSNI